MNERKITENDKLAAKAMILALGSVFCCFIIPIGLPTVLASVAIILALISRGLEKHFGLLAKRALITAFIGIALNIAIAGAAYYSVQRIIHDREFRGVVNNLLEKRYGTTFDEFAAAVDKEYGTNLVEQLEEGAR